MLHMLTPHRRRLLKQKVGFSIHMSARARGFVWTNTSRAKTDPNELNWARAQQKKKQEETQLKEPTPPTSLRPLGFLPVLFYSAVRSGPISISPPLSATTLHQIHDPPPDVDFINGGSSRRYATRSLHFNQCALIKPWRPKARAFFSRSQNRP